MTAAPAAATLPGFNMLGQRQLDRRLALVCFFGVIAMTASVGAVERTDVPDKYKWNLGDLYPSEAAWTKAKDALAKRVPEMAKHKGRLGKSAKDLLAALQDMFDADLELSRLSVYANSLSDEDVRAARPREMKQAAEELVTSFSSAMGLEEAPHLAGVEVQEQRHQAAED